MNDPPAITQEQADAQHAARVDAYARRQDRPHCDKPGTCQDCPFKRAERIAAAAAKLERAGRIG